MNYKLFFLCFLFFRAYSDYTALQLFLLATNPNDAAAIYANIKPEELSKSRPGKSKAATPEVQAAIQKKPAGGGAAPADCLTKEDLKAIEAKYGTLPTNVNTPALAKAALVEIAKPGNTLGQLLGEICQNSKDADDVREAIGKITPKA